MTGSIQRRSLHVLRRSRRFATGFAALAAGLWIAATAIAQGLPGSPDEYLRRMDTNGDGRVSRDEYIAWMGRSFDRIDTDHNGVLEGDELPEGSHAVTRADYDKRLAAAFERQDGNHDHYLDARELAKPPR